jgi:2-methylcitrate dehydratase PrpD
MAGLLAAQGFDSAREFLTAEHGGLYRAYDDGGGRPDKVTEGLGKRWEFEQIALRPWPAGSTIQGILTGVFDLVEKHGLRPDDVKKLRVTASPRVAATNGGLAQYKNKFEALLSIHYVASVIFHDRALTLAQFDPARYNDPALRKFSERVEVKAEPSFDGITATVEALTADGRTLSVHVEHPRGAPENPMSWNQIADKFRGCAQGRIPADRAEAVIGAVARLETLGSTRELMGLVRAA